MWIRSECWRLDPHSLQTQLTFRFCPFFSQSQHRRPHSANDSREVLLVHGAHRRPSAAHDHGLRSRAGHGHRSGGRIRCTTRAAAAGQRHLLRDGAHSGAAGDGAVAPDCSGEVRVYAEGGVGKNLGSA